MVIKLVEKLKGIVICLQESEEVDELKVYKDLNDFKSSLIELVELSLDDEVGDYYDRLYSLLENIGYLSSSPKLRTLASECIDLLEEF